MDTQACPRPHFSPTRPKTERRPGAGSLVGWVPSPVLQLNLEPKVLPARAELVPRYPKLAFLPLPAQLRAADPALAGPPRLGWSRGPFPAPQTFGPGPPSTHILLLGRQTPVPRHPSPPPPRPPSAVIFPSSWPAAPLSQGEVPTPPAWLLGAPPPRPRMPNAWSPHLPQRRPVPLLLKALTPVVGEVGAEAPEAVELLALPRRALPRVQHPALQRQPAAPKKRAEHGPGPSLSRAHGSRRPRAMWFAGLE